MFTRFRPIAALRKSPARIIHPSLSFDASSFTQSIPSPILSSLPPSNIVTPELPIQHFSKPSLSAIYPSKQYSLIKPPYMARAFSTATVPLPPIAPGVKMLLSGEPDLPTQKPLLNPLSVFLADATYFQEGAELIPADSYFPLLNDGQGEQPGLEPPGIQRPGEPYVNEQGYIEYADPEKGFPYYSQLDLPNEPVDISNFAFNRQAVTRKNPYGQVAEGSSHQVFRTLGKDGKVYFVKLLNKHRDGVERDQETIEVLAAQECSVAWLTAHLASRRFICRAVLVMYKGKIIGIASQEMPDSIGTFHNVGLGARYTSMEMQNGDTPLKVHAGKTYLEWGPDKKLVRLMGRIRLKAYLKAAAEYDEANEPKNAFASLVADSLNKAPHNGDRLVAWPGTFDVGCAWHPGQMRQYIKAVKNLNADDLPDPNAKSLLVRELAFQRLDTIEDLDVKGFEMIEARFLTKELALKHVGNLPVEIIEKGAKWFKDHVPPEAHGHADIVREYLYAARELFGLAGVLLEQKRKN
jgi:hypothetical protein